jgi:hypothetical protein
MTDAAPRLTPWLRDAIVRFAREPLTSAEINRRVGGVAADVGVPKPSYQQVRVLVVVERSQRHAQPCSGVLPGGAIRARSVELFVKCALGARMRR